MKLIIAILQDRDNHTLSHRLLTEGFSFTRLGSTGGFLRQGNTTLLIGVEEDDIDRVMTVLRECCHSSERFMNLPPESVAPFSVGSMPPQPVKAKSGGAVAFVMDVGQVERF